MGNNKIKQFGVRVIDERAGIPEGSFVYGHKKTKTLYIGEWPSMWGTYEVRLKKKYCKLEKIKK